MPSRRRRLARSVLGALVLLGTTACETELAEPVTSQQYLDGLEEVCAATTEELATLPRPPEQISVADFASSAASALDDEAEQIRLLESTDELDDDHRALIRNTDEQAAAWRRLGGEAAAGSADLGDVTQLIGELTLGRNDLATEMGAAACVREGLGS